MAIKKTTNIGNTGLSGDHWALFDIQLHLGAETDTTLVVACYALWVDEAARMAGRAPIRKGRRISVVIASADPKISDIEAALEAKLMEASVPAVEQIRRVRAEPAVRAITAIAYAPAVVADPSNGIKAKPAVAARDAVQARKAIKEVKGRARRMAVPGGELEGGTVV